MHIGEGSSPFLVMKDIHKTYSSNGVHACNDIGLSIEQGTTHVIVGENGAGKSTIMKILSGDLAPDSGSIVLRGNEISFKHPEDALNAGIGMIHQILHFFPSLTVREHLILGMKTLPSWKIIQRQEIDTHIQEICEKYRITCNPDERVDHLSAEARQLTALMTLISRDTELFILDEPLLNVLQTAQRLKQEGKTIIVITHNIQDALSFGDYITVLRNGKKQGTFIADDLSRDMLAQLIMGNHDKKLMLRNGKDREERVPAIHSSGEEPRIRLSHVSGGNLDTQNQVYDISLKVYAGETVAVVGIRDNGLRALESLVSGQNGNRFRLTHGTIAFVGKPHYCRDRYTVGYVPSDRLSIGSSIKMNVTENLLINMRRDPRYTWQIPLPGKRHIPIPIFKKSALTELTDNVIDSFSITGKAYHPLESLSGGNIQKLITARALYHSPKVLICADISWGLDIKTRETLFNAIEKQKKAGMAVLFFTSEVPTALDEADRIAILRRGHLMDVLVNHEDLTARDIGRLML